jgi:hypothetical protein
MIRRSLAVAALAFVLLSGRAFAQNPAPTPAAATAPATAAPVSTAAPAQEAEVVDDTGESKPWIRLTWLVPLAIVLGAGSVLGRRLLIERGWLDAA